jgi:aminopeptidase N
VVNDIFTVMEKDSIGTSHAVSTVIEDPNHVQQFFDEISYEKVGFFTKKKLFNRYLIAI